MSLKYDKEIKEWIDKNREDIINQWIGICKTPAIKETGKPSAPFGEPCAKALSECTEAFKKRGFQTMMYKEDGYSLISFGTGEKTIGIFTHSDVVPAGDGWLYTTPFEPILKNGALIGRGVEDNKSGIMMSLCAMEIIREYSLPLNSKIQLFIGSNEETGMEDIKAFAKNQKMPEISLVPDAEFPCSTGEKGICHLFAKGSEALCDIIDFCGGEAFNIVLDNATATIKDSENLRAELTDKIKNDERFKMELEGGCIKISSKGVAKHASIPEGSVNAAGILAELLSEISSLNASDRMVMKQMAEILSCPFGTSLGIDFCDELFGRLTIVNGIVSVENGRIKLSFDMRYGSGIDSDDLIEKTKSGFEKFNWEIEIEDNMPGFSIDTDSKIPGILEDIYKEATGCEKKSIKLGGGTYARIIKNAFSLGTYTKTTESIAEPFKMPQGHGEAHQCDEMIDIESFFNAVRVIVYYILEIDKAIN